jgi:hypothetical protein
MCSYENGSTWDFLAYLIHLIHFSLLFSSFLARLLVHNCLLFYSYGPRLIGRLPLYGLYIIFTKCIGLGLSLVGAFSPLCYCLTWHMLSISTSAMNVR